MQQWEPCFSQLNDPQIFQINRMKAHTIFNTYFDLAKALNFEKSDNTLCLNGQWYFYYSENPDLRPKGFYEKGYDYSQWARIEVPSHIQLQGYGKPQYLNKGYPWDGHADVKSPNVPHQLNAVGSYITTFKLPDKWDVNVPTSIRLDGVESAFYIWLNGHFIGYSEDSFTPAEFDISSYLCEGENILAVEVFKYCSGSWLEDQDFFRFSGIFRNVYVNQRNSIHLYDFTVNTDLSDDLTEAATEISLDIKNTLASDEAIELSCSLYDNTTLIKQFKHQIHTISEHSIRSYTVSEIIKNIKLWSTEKPNLYTLILIVRTEATTEYIPFKFGFRKFEIKNGIMHLNNKRIIFNGINRHEFCHKTGRAIQYEQMLWDIKQLKRNNINAVRTSHYPNQHEWYSLCDEYGIYVMDEANIETHGTWRYNQDCRDTAIPYSRPEWKNAVIDRIKSMYQRDKNHPSILIWSLGNESYGGQNFILMKDYLKSVDQSRVVHYEGVYHNKEFQEATEIESTMYFSPDEVRAYAARVEKPYIQCEYAHAMGNSLGALSDYVKISEEIEGYQGGFIWDYIDQAILTQDKDGTEFFGYGGDFGDYPNTGNFSGNGLVLADRTLSPKMFAAKHCYQMINIELNIESKTAQLTNKYLFTNLIEFNLIFTIEKDGSVLKTAPIICDLPPGEQKKLKLPDYCMDSWGVYVLTLSIQLKNDTKWAEKGYEIAFQQKINMMESEAKFEESYEKLKVVNGLDLISIFGYNFSCAFSRKQEKLISYRLNDKELLGRIARPNFWRAPTDNDLGNAMPFRCHAWKSSSDYLKIKRLDVNEKEAFVEVICDYQLPIHEDLKCRVTYTLYGESNVAVTLYYKGVKNLPELPELSFMFTLDPSYNQMEWFGLGPFETYADRKDGAKYGIYSCTVKDNFTHYLRPQECGKKSEVRWAKIFNKKGEGIMLTALSDSFDISVLEHSPNEIEAATHLHKLHQSDKTVVRVIHKQMGVGGDNSWGAPVHDNYRVKSDQEYCLKFLIRPL